MGLMVVSNALLTCTFGAAPSTFQVVVPLVKGGGQPAANIMDMVPMTNIMPFGMCSSMANPQVAAATAAAMGVLTPMPCVPATAAPWAPGKPMITVRKQPAVDDTCKCLCSYGGSIAVSFAGQVIVQLK